jgi:ATP-dependent Lon protease
MKEIEEHIEEKTRKQIWDEIQSVEDKTEHEMSKSIDYLTNVFKLPWGKRAPTYWNIQHCTSILESTHYGINNTKQRIIQFIAKNKRFHNTKGKLLLFCVFFCYWVFYFVF